ncbi:MAG TPA: UDP-N-acetylmuramoyl-L-alanine--D-glutamate ligase [Geminicoccaceae bacterium]|nr:UDP-N-acetylmuramoyl-L-alanine--D-glutamate ligase [Geminicoccus sp.]HMU50211.1 UDP-N-acetylmuramoyl-L-alanine--D-glutamate ligase [Geminicoccaceae bacterium]
MTGLQRFRGRKVGVLGMARSGIAAARALRAAGAEVLGWDDRAESLGGIAPGRPEDIQELAALVTSPGVPLTHPVPHPVIAAARQAGVPITCDIDLFCEISAPERIVAVTGTNGKSTTSALIHHLLLRAGEDAELGGNIGVPVFDLRRAERYVLEVSSYQLDLCSSFHPGIAVWTNLTPDHLDRHGDLEGYIAAKRRIFSHQQAGDWAILGVDDAPSAALADRQAAQTLRVAIGQPVEGEGFWVVDGVLHERRAGVQTAVGRVDGFAGLRGRHNQQNAALAFAVGRVLGHAADTLLAGLASFQGLAHRMEEVARTGPVLWVNDSKATNPESATKSLDAFDAVFWIAGGKPKPGGFASLRPFMRNVREAFLIGQAADEIEADLGDLVRVRRSGTLERAMAEAGEAALASGCEPAVVLLAPACASFDQFKSYEHRGDVFRDLARARLRAEAAA